MANAPDIDTVWEDVQAQLPAAGASIVPLRIDRPDRGATLGGRIAIALAPDHSERAARAATPEAALRGLVQIAGGTRWLAD